MNESLDAEQSRVRWDALIIVAFVALLVLASFASFYGVRFVFGGVALGGIALYSVRVLITGVARFACGFFLGRLLVQISPWKVFSLLVVCTSALYLVNMVRSWYGIAWSVEWIGTSAIEVVLRTLGTLLLDLAFVSLGVWLGQRARQLAT